MPITREQIRAKNQAASLAQKLLVRRLPKLRELLIKDLHVVHSWSSGVAKKYANPRTAFTVIIPCSSHTLNYLTLSSLIKGIKFLDKTPDSPVVHSTPAGMFVVMGFDTFLEHLEELLDFKETK